MLDFEHIDGNPSSVPAPSPLGILLDCKHAYRADWTLQAVRTRRRVSSYCSRSIVSYKLVISFALRQSSVSLNCLKASWTLKRRALRKRLDESAADSKGNDNEMHNAQESRIIMARRHVRAIPRLIYALLFAQSPEVGKRLRLGGTQVAQMAVGEAEFFDGGRHSVSRTRRSSSRHGDSVDERRDGGCADSRVWRWSLVQGIPRPLRLINAVGSDSL